MIDWHCHVLPAVDDGSRSVEESLELLKMQKEQGMNTVIATPHFYANDGTVDEFLQRRNRAFAQLEPLLTEAHPDVILGAEVRYYEGISRMADLTKLCIEGTSLLLLEMPMNSWNEYMMGELVELSGRGDIKIVLAHVERYFGIVKKSAWKRILDSEILLQVNSSFFTELITRRKALSYLKDGNVRLIGSDCHNVNRRPPRIGKAFEIIEKKLGDDFLCMMNGYGKNVLGIK